MMMRVVEKTGQKTSVVGSWMEIIHSLHHSMHGDPGDITCALTKGGPVRSAFTQFTESGTASYTQFTAQGDVASSQNRASEDLSTLECAPSPQMLNTEGGGKDGFFDVRPVGQVVMHVMYK